MTEADRQRLERKMDVLLALSVASAMQAERDRRRRNRSLGDRLWDLF